MPNDRVPNDRAPMIRPDPYSFRPVDRRDLPLLNRWLRTPEVVRWWGAPEEQAALLREDLDEPRMVMELVSFAGRPFAYAQNYDTGTWPQPHLADLPPGARAIDAFIGEPDMLGVGHGSAFLRLLAARLRAGGAPVVAIDPNAANTRARLAYAKAGFVETGRVETPEGPVVVMVFGDTAVPSR